jgi:hypothetical protein
VPNSNHAHRSTSTQQPRCKTSQTNVRAPNLAAATDAVVDPNNNTLTYSLADMPLFCLIRRSLAAGEAGWVRAQGEHRERDEWFVAVEPERDAGEEPDLRVR